MVLLHQTGGLPKLQIRNLLNDISWTTDPNSKKNHRIAPHDALYQNFTNGSTPLISHLRWATQGPRASCLRWIPNIFHRVCWKRSKSENSNVFNSQDEIYLGFTEKKYIFFLFYTFYRPQAMSRPLKNEVLKIQKRTFLANPNNFGTKIFVTLYLRKCMTLNAFVNK